MVLLIKLYKVVLTFESADEIVKCEDANETGYSALLSNGAVYYTVVFGEMKLELFFIMTLLLELWLSAPGLPA